jgi:aerobic-type carbon monoxide dehydrogenase small subunit (CoxS/CutS family)
VQITLQVNGVSHTVDVAPAQTLLSALRDSLDLTGTKYGCGEGQCGACTVLIDRQPVKSCQVRASLVQNKPITTIEGLERNGQLHPVQQAFLDAGALQCGYCTPGFVMALTGLLKERGASPDPETLLEDLQGNLCRCTGYASIVRAVRALREESV